MSEARLQALLLAALLTARSAAAVAPPVVPWREAAAHVGAVVSVEGAVTHAHTAGDTCVLEFADDPRAFRVVVVLGVFESAPREPERIWAGRRVRATGRIERFQGRVEMIVRGANQIELLEAPGAPASEARAPASPAAPPTTLPPPLPPPPPPPQARPVERPLGDAAPCERAHATWRAAADDVKLRLAALARCLDALRYDCAAERAALAPALDGLATIERQVVAACR
jgi:hypothetical protein